MNKLCNFEMGQVKVDGNTVNNFNMAMFNVVSNIDIPEEENDNIFRHVSLCKSIFFNFINSSLNYSLTLFFNRYNNIVTKDKAKFAQEDVYNTINSIIDTVISSPISSIEYMATNADNINSNQENVIFVMGFLYSAIEYHNISLFDINNEDDVKQINDIQQLLFEFTTVIMNILTDLVNIAKNLNK